MDNVQLNAPETSGAVIATEDVGGVQHQKIIAEFSDGAGGATMVSSLTPLPVSASIDTTGLATAANQQTDALTNTELRATPLPISGTVNTGLSQGLTDAQLRATPVPISGTISTGLSQPLTDTQLRATPVPVSGTVTANTGLVQALTDTQLRAADVKITLDGETVPVTGTFYQATQPVSAASLPLPTGAATETTLGALNTKIPSGLTVTGSRLQVELPTGGGGLTDTELRATPVPVSGTITANTGLSQPLTDTQLRASAVPVSITSSQSSIPVSFAPGTADSFGHLITGGINNQIDIQFYRDTPANLTTVTTGSGGSATATGGMATFAATTTANSFAKAVSLTTTRYTAGSEIYALFTAAFTGTGAGTSYQRIGLYNTTDGFFIGKTANSFGITVRKGSVDTTTPKASFSVDTLVGGVGSLFTRAGVPEAIDLTKLNVYRIRLGWVGSAPIYFEVLSPDGQWVVFHKVLQPNNAAVPSVESADLPVTCNVNSGNSGNALTILSNCWGAGTTQALGKLNEPLTDSAFAALNRSVISGVTTGGGGGYVNVKVNPSGSLVCDVTGTVTANLAAGTNNIGDVDIVSVPAITKGTQGSTGLTVQDLKDAGRTQVRFFAVAAASGTTTTETAITLTRSAGTAATTTGTSFVITSGKTFRITSIMFATRGNATGTIQSTTFNFRINTGGAVTTGTTPIVLSARCANAATASAWDRFIVPIFDGWEIVGDGTIQFGITAAATFTTNAPTWDVYINGFEY